MAWMSLKGLLNGQGWADRSACEINRRNRISRLSNSHDELALLGVSSFSVQ